MKKFIYIVVALLFVGGIVFLIVSPGKGGKYDSFATCVANSGAKFYGAFWCPHCQSEKSKFGKSAKLLPYIECSTPDGQGQTEVCKVDGITTYPTWVFPSTGTTTGDLELSEIAEKTSCPLPTN